MVLINNLTCDKSFKMHLSQMSHLSHMEDKIQAEFHKMLRNKYPLTASLCNHVPNGGRMSDSERLHAAAIGVVGGWPDYQVMIPAGPYHGLYIEFKDKGKKTYHKRTLTPHEARQHKVQGRLREAGYMVVECDDAAEALSIFEEYAKGTRYLQTRSV